jgi:hypothetical protein
MQFKLLAISIDALFQNTGPKKTAHAAPFFKMPDLD